MCDTFIHHVDVCGVCVLMSKVVVVVVILSYSICIIYHASFRPITFLFRCLKRTHLNLMSLIKNKLKIQNKTPSNWGSATSAMSFNCYWCFCVPVQCFFWNASTSFSILSIVPVTRPNSATTRIIQFLPSKNLPGPSVEPHALTNSITGGNIKANPDEQSAPIREMKAFRAGTTSANESERMRRKKLVWEHSLLVAPSNVFSGNTYR